MDDHPHLKEAFYCLSVYISEATAENLLSGQQILINNPLAPPPGPCL